MKRSTASACSSPAILSSAVLARRSPPSFAICRSATLSFGNSLLLYRELEEGDLSVESIRTPENFRLIAKAPGCPV
ncbi:exported hypothetical protein [Thiocapsa sp. KS1]|nr:exported hypothetical protein [Thiocapsa sp. KS1]